MTGSLKHPSKRITNEPLPSTQVSSRNDIFEQDQIDPETLKEEAERMDLLMRQLMGGDEEEGEQEVIETIEEDEPKEEEAEEFSFRLFSNQTVATVKIADEKDSTDHWAKAVADQQEYEFDETDPEFLARVNQAIVDYDTILKQSTTSYPTLRLPHRVLHIDQQGEDKNKKIEKKVVKKRKSKKCRDFEKAVKEGKIVLKPNMRKSEDGWPGWPGTSTRVAIINYEDGKKKKAMNHNNSTSRGGFRGGRGGGMMNHRGNSRGGGMFRGGSRGGAGGAFRGGRGKLF